MSPIRRCALQTFLFLLLALAASVPVSAQTPLFNQCPHIGFSTGCAYLVVVTDGATNVLSDRSQLPFDGADDTLVGVQNSSSTPLASLPLNGSGMGIFAFNGDGICAPGLVPAPPGACPFGPTGYEGPGTSFTGISADLTSGTVTFSPAIPPGGHAYFSLEGYLTATSTPLSLICNPNVGPSQLGTFYSTTCTVSGGPVSSQFLVPGAPVYHWSIVAGTFPPGLSLSSTTGSTVTLSGIPGSLGAYSYSIQVTDNSVPSPQSTSQPFVGNLSSLGGLCNNTLSAGSASVGLAASNGSVLVSSPPGCPQWSASSPVPWVTITSGANGTGNGSVNFSVGAANADGVARSATLSIAGQSFVINQLSGCLFGVSPLKASVASGAGSGTINVGVLNPTCAWTAAPDPNSFWLTVNGPGMGIGPGTVSFTVAPNSSTSSRTGTINVAGQTFTVIQAGSNCSFSLAQATQAFPAVGGIGIATVQAPAGCVSPPNTSSVPWVTFSSAGGSGNGTVSYVVQPNPGLAGSRTGTLTIAGQPYAVTQAGTSPLTCIASVATPPQVATEGRTEVLGDLVLSCAGILGALTADISLTLNTNVTNAVTGVNTTDAVLTVNGNNPQSGLVSGYNIIHWPGVSLTLGSQGVATVRITKVRADASLLGAAANLQSVAVTGLVTVNAALPVPVTNALQTMANAGPALLFRRLPPPPTPFGEIIYPLQYAEATPAAFQAAAGTATATRLRLVLTNVPAGVQVLAPVFPNEGGTAQLYSADFNGAGGSPISGVAQSPLTVTGGVASATWVVLAADPGQFDTFTFYLYFLNVAGIDLSQMQITASLGPVSDVSVASATAPVPRYRDFSVMPKLVNLRTTSQTLYPPLAFGAPPLAIFSNQLVNDNPSQAATNVVVRDRVTAGGIIQGCQASGGANCTVTGNEAVVTYATLQPAQSVNVTLQVGFDPAVPAGTVVQSLFSAVSDQPNADLSGTSSSAIYVTSGAVGNPSFSLIATFGTPQVAPVGVAFPNALQATLRDSAGNPLSGALVTFTAPSTGPSAVLSSGTALTNALGVASVTAMANNTVGSYNVTASYPGTGTQTTLTAVFGLTNLPSLPPITDLAQGKQATQSSTLPGTPAAGAAVDGNTDGAFFDGSVTATNLDTNAWWQVDLGASTPIITIVVWNRTDCCASRLSDYWVFVSDTPFLPTDTPATLQNRAGTFAVHQTTAPNPSTAILALTQGRYLRVQLTSPNYLSLAEVQVFGAANLALGKTATQSSTLPGTPAAGAAVDGNTDGAFFDGSVTATNLDTNAWWQVDLGASMPVGSIVVWNRTDCCASRLNDYWVFVSDTPFLPTDTPATLQFRAATFSSHQTAAPNPSTSISALTQGRYVRIQLTNPNYLSLAEVQVFSPGAAPPARVATQSSTLPGAPTAGAGSAIDGNTDGSFFDGSVTATNLDTNAWWQVDMGAPTAINSVTVWNRTDCCGSRLGDYWVFVSNTPFLPTDTPATLQNRAGTSGSHQTTAPSPSVTIPFGVQGRYVRVQLTGTDYLSLAEVQVQ